MKLGVNIDHVAVLREARKVNDPDILQALFVACENGADQITIHLREDRRHIQDSDVVQIMRHSKLPVNLECSINQEIIEIVCASQPYRATLVPEKREEVTTEGGLDVVGSYDAILTAIQKLKQAHIATSLFIDPTKEAVETSKKLGVDMVELHTGHFANIYAMLYGNLASSHHSIAALERSQDQLTAMLEEALVQIQDAAHYAKELGLEVAAGHGLNYQNVEHMVGIDAITELNIGQSIIARSVFSGLREAVQEMKRLTSR